MKTRFAMGCVILAFCNLAFAAETWVAVPPADLVGHKTAAINAVMQNSWNCVATEGFAGADFAVQNSFLTLRWKIQGANAAYTNSNDQQPFLLFSEFSSSQVINREYRTDITVTTATDFNSIVKIKWTESYTDTLLNLKDPKKKYYNRLVTDEAICSPY